MCLVVSTLVLMIILNRCNNLSISAFISKGKSTKSINALKCTTMIMDHRAEIQRIYTYINNLNRSIWISRQVGVFCGVPAYSLNPIFSLGGGGDPYNAKVCEKSLRAHHKALLKNSVRYCLCHVNSKWKIHIFTNM